MRPSDAIEQARLILNDPDDAGARWTSTQLLVYFNTFVKALARARVDLFLAVASVSLVAGRVQSVSAVTTNGLSKVVSDSGGNHVRELTPEQLALILPFAATTPAAHFMRELPVELANIVVPLAGSVQPMLLWSRVPDDPFRFQCWPPATGGQTCTALVAQVPTSVLPGNVSADYPVADSFLLTAAAFIAGTALSINTNAADTQKGIALIAAAQADMKA